ncbi:glycosyl hydrolase-related protein [Candidatus Aminicenantes bacterium AC-334-E05]|nr:glycosyl hydrolase-related protein [Candidatus Aminicenantes bacterium AC-334-E05]
MRRKNTIFLILFLLVLFSNLAGRNIDSVINELQNAIDLKIKNWIYTENTSINPFSISDFSLWKKYNIRERLMEKEVWFRGKITLPEKFLGYNIFGCRVFLNFELDDAGLVWINGEPKGRFEWNGKFLLTESAEPEKEYTIIIKGINYGGPLRLLRAELEIERAKNFVEKIKDIILCFQTASKLLSFDTYQSAAWIKYDPKIDKSPVPRHRRLRLREILNEGANSVNIKALKKGNREVFLLSVQNAFKKLKPVRDFIREYTIELIGNAHIDAAWLWRKSETIEVCKNTFSNVIKLMETFSAFTYAQSSAHYYEWMETLYPELFERIREKVKKGNWEIVGGMMVEPDCNLISGESWVRHLLYGKNYFIKKFDINVEIGWNPDSFGYNWNMPQIYSQSGIKAFITQKISWNDTNVFPYRIFWWKSPDGSRILVYFPFSYVYDFKNPFILIDRLRQFEANTGLRNMLVLYGVGDHGGGPTYEMLEIIEKLKNLEIFPRIKFTTSKKYFEDFLFKQDLSEIPVWKDELYLEYHRGTYTTQAKIKEYNRKCENLLVNAESISLISYFLGGEYNQRAFKKAWKKVLFNQFHDILPGSGIREIYIDALKDYKIAEKLAKKELFKSLKYIASRINTSKIKGNPLIVFNPSPWERTDIVKLKVHGFIDYKIRDFNGKEIPHQIIDLDEEIPDEIRPREVIFIAENIPAFGYKIFSLEKTNLKIKKKKSSPFKNEIENEFYRITFDEKTGLIKSIFDKRNKKEVLSGYGNQLQLFGDKPSRWDAWNIGYTGEEWKPKFDRIELIANGPICYIVRAYFNFFNPKSSAKRINAHPTLNYPNSFFVCDTILYNMLNRIEFRTKVDWWESHTLLKTSFDVNVQNEKASFEIPFGFIQRPTTMKNNWEKARFEVPALRWVDLSQPDYGVSILTRSKYGYDIHGNRMRVTLLRSPTDPDPTADRGIHFIDYALVPHEKDWRESNIPRIAHDYNNPFISLILKKKSKGKLPLSKSFLCLKPSNILFSSFKLSEDNMSFILRIYEAYGKNTSTEIILPFEPKEVYKVDFLENGLERISFNKNIIKISVPKFKVVTLKILRK